MIYLDASFVMATLFDEVYSERAAALLDAADPSDICSSRWLAVEVMSAIGVKVRSNLCDAMHAATIRAQFERQFGTVTNAIGIDGRAFERATLYLARPALALKSGDALHLAVASLAGASIATFDKQMIAAARAVGAAVAEV